MEWKSRFKMYAFMGLHRQGDKPAPFTLTASKTFNNLAKGTLYHKGPV